MRAGPSVVGMCGTSRRQLVRGVGQGSRGGSRQGRDGRSWRVLVRDAEAALVQHIREGLFEFAL